MGPESANRVLRIFAILLTLPGCSAPPPPPAAPASTEVPRAVPTGSAADLPCPEQPTPPKPLSANWSACPFPSDADRRGINSAKVTLALCIDATGHASSSLVVEDPGYGFAEAALQCAAKMGFEPGLDSSGNIAEGRFVLSVRFQR